MFRILALTGGGLRGSFAIGILAEFEKRLNRPIANYFDLIAGTSTGSITAASLSYGLTAADVHAFYQKYGHLIFKPREPFRPKPVYRPIYSALRNLLKNRAGTNLDDFFQSRYCPFALTDSMVEGFGQHTMSDVKHSRLVIPTVNLTDGQTYVFRTPHLPDTRPEYDWNISDIIVAATAAPTYFPHKLMPDGKCYADGGLWANDPGVVALSEAAQIIDRKHHCRGDTLQLANVHMISIGTGQSSYSLTPPGGDAGALYWVRHVAEVMGVSQVQGAKLPLSMMLGDRYRQVDFPIEDKSWTLDNLEIMEQLFEMGQQQGRAMFDELSATYFSEAACPYWQ